MQYLETYVASWTPARSGVISSIHWFLVLNSHVEFVAFQQTRGLDLSSSRTSETISVEQGDGSGANLDIALHCEHVNDHRQSRYRTGLQIRAIRDQSCVSVIPLIVAVLTCVHRDHTDIHTNNCARDSRLAVF